MFEIAQSFLKKKLDLVTDCQKWLGHFTLRIWHWKWYIKPKQEKATENSDEWGEWKQVSKEYGKQKWKTIGRIGYYAFLLALSWIECHVVWTTGSWQWRSRTSTLIFRPCPPAPVWLLLPYLVSGRFLYWCFAHIHQTHPNCSQSSGPVASVEIAFD